MSACPKILGGSSRHSSPFSALRRAARHAFMYALRYSGSPIAFGPLPDGGLPGLREAGNPFFRDKSALWADEEDSGPGPIREEPTAIVEASVAEDLLHACARPDLNVFPHFSHLTENAMM